ncbi:ribokinase [Liquorilactobacillus nagelii]|uniref:ribokinase n=1 Tax=Liquorilactobacillus nagelii TaxID=82688 RepID=UPI0006F09932|nr:ribokinase [Liquorilactobacillus nagelii]KRL41135.1 ribokinase [Liquorilactobacillus nagelii DSM 13675]QYH54063.1 ribokinase [Liquorilactobacillus nagelii DSM 13675]
MNSVTVIGSLNIDTTLQIEKFPLPGETIKALNKSSTAGGKGANQAVAAVRSGALTNFIGKVGNDQSGEFLVEALKEENIDVSGIGVAKNIGTGTANILLDKNGQNSIIVYGGANNKNLSQEVAESSNKIKQSDFLIGQFEIPQSETVRAFLIAKKNHVKTILNPAPAEKVERNLLDLTDIVVPNEFESEILTGIPVIDLSSMKANAKKFNEMGIANVIITLGEKGVFYSFSDNFGILLAMKVKAVDTTAAGDTFIGALSAELDPNFENLVSAINYAQRASALTVQRLGAQVSIPTNQEVNSI